MRGETSGSRFAARRLKDRIEQLEYARDMIRELRDMMAAERFEMLTFQLEMAYLEASDRLREMHAAIASEPAAAAGRLDDFPQN
jgi:uncharacterized coiled-coil protein SlyX